jgi:phage shock protein C
MPGVTVLREALLMEQLRRPKDGRVIAGVCAGIADRFGISRTLVRVLTVASIVLPGSQLIVYVALWVLVPSEGSRTPSPA